MTDDMQPRHDPTPVECCEAIVREIWDIQKGDDHTLPMNEVKDAIQMALLVASYEHDVSIDRQKTLARLAWRAEEALDRLQAVLDRANILARAGLPRATPETIDRAARIIRREYGPKAA